MEKKTNTILGLIIFGAFIGVGVILPITLMYEKVDYIEIYSDDDFKDYKFAGEGTIDDPYIIEDLTIIDQKNEAISIRNTNSYFIIRNCYLDNNFFAGIQLDTIGKGTAIIYNNTIERHSIAGIRVLSSDEVTIIDNTCYENAKGIQLDNSDSSKIYNNHVSIRYPQYSTTEGMAYGIEVLGSSLINIHDNTLQNVAFGVTIERSEDCSVTSNVFQTITHINIELLIALNNTINNNTCNSFSFYGISLRYSDINIISENSIIDTYYAIYIYRSEDNLFQYNELDENHYGVFSLENSEENIISYNIIMNSEFAGVHILDSNDNSVHHNSFYFNNVNASSQGYDDGIGNKWYDTFSLEGNYWNSWNSTLSYSIFGLANNTDPFPFLTPP